MKSVLLLDTPESCFACPLCIGETCIMLEKTVITDDYSERSKDCPLRNLPQKTVCNVYKYENYKNGLAKGWNDCLDMITKGVLGEME